MKHRRALAVAGACIGLGALAPTASADLDEVNTQRLRDGVTINGILQHARAFQFSANLNGGTRASGTPGYDASAAYVADRLEDAGYEVTEQEFEFPFFDETAPAELAQVSPTPTTYVNGTDFLTLQYSGSGDVTGPVVPVDVTVPAGATAGTSGCEPADFAGFPAGGIALVQRGTCPFGVKAQNAQAAGAAAVVVFNSGVAGAVDVFNGTLGGPGITIPALGASYALGEQLVTAARAGEVQLRVAATTVSETRTTRNVLGDTPGGDPSELVVVGAHLDSVADGAGINDNGSGTGSILEVAEEMAELGVNPRRKVRFAFWGAEESGLLGSTYYVQSADAETVADHYANLNFDMVGSPNFVRFVYDGDNSTNSTGAAAGPPGSAQLEDLFVRYFAGQGLPTDPTPFNGRSDYGPFIAAGVPAGGLFTGAEGIKTPEQAAVYGGTAGVAYDPNYHEVGDTINNVNTTALSQMSDGIAHAVLTLARSRSGLFEDDSRRAARGAKRLAFRGDAAQR